MDEPAEPYKITDLGTLKALAHPRRQRILDYLDQHGPATSSTLARALGLNTGATSYHLRELARFGLIEDAPAVGSNRRERWWRTVHADIRFPMRSEQDSRTREAVDRFGEQVLQEHMREFQRAKKRLSDDDPWSDAFPFSNGTITVTLQELEEFFEGYIALLQRYQRPPEQTPAEARTVVTSFLGFPAPSPDQPDPPA